MTKSVPGSQGEKPIGMKMWYKVALIMLASSKMMGTTPSYLQIRATRRIVMKNGTVSAKIAPRLKCYKNASRLNRYNFPTDNAIDFLFSTFHTTPFHYGVLKIGSR